MNNENYARLPNNVPPSMSDLKLAYCLLDGDDYEIIRFYPTSFKFTRVYEYHLKQSNVQVKKITSNILIVKSLNAFTPIAEVLLLPPARFSESSKTMQNSVEKIC